jgi:hypothetical protein
MYIGDLYKPLLKIPSPAFLIQFVMLSKVSVTFFGLEAYPTSRFLS